MNPWIAGARPRTLPAAVVPVLVGTAVAIHDGNAIWSRAVLALIVSLALQVGVNYANDYSDGIRGTDDERVGPLRLVGSGLKTPAAVKRAAFISFAVGAAAGLVLSLLASPWLLIVGALSLLGAWFYTGGKNPYGYKGLGELSVFVFFGLVAVVGTAYAQLEKFTGLSFIAAVPVGMLAVALLLVNNLRDRIADAQSGKRTLSVRVGDTMTRQLYMLCAAFPFVIAFCIAFGNFPVVCVALALPLLVVPVKAVTDGAVGPALVTVLKQTARLQLVFGVLFTIGLAFS